MASEIRVNKIINRSGLSTVTFSDTGAIVSGIVTATSFVGSGANLTGLPAETTINNNASTKFITGSGSANTLDCEANLSYNNSLVTFSSSNFLVDKGTNPTITAKETAGNKEVQLRANTTGGLLRTVGSYPLVLGTNQTERLRIASGGQVIIGDDDTDKANGNFDDLIVGANASTTEAHGITIVCGNAATNGGIAFSDGSNGGADAYRGMISYQHNDNHMQFRTNATERVRITSDGKIGINQTSPAHKLHVEDGSSGVIVAKQTTNNGGYNIFEGDASDGTTKFYVTHNGRVGAADGIIFGTDTAGANILNDYEEGNWTPTLNSGSFTAYNLQWYRKIGKLVTCYFYMYNFSGGTSGTGINIGGLPFAKGNATETFFSVQVGGNPSLPSGCIQVMGRVGQVGNNSIELKLGYRGGGHGTMTYGQAGNGHFAATFSYSA